MSRRFLYMAVGNCLDAPTSYTLHRINPSRLFYPKDSPERAAAAAAAGARATTIEAAEAAERARTTAMQATEAARSASNTTDRAARRAALRAAMMGRATKRTKADDAEKARLPAPRMTFSSPGIAMDFALIGQTKDKIVVVDGANPGYTGDDWDAPGRAVLYNDVSHSVRAQLCVGLPERHTVPVAVGDSLYFMDEEVPVVPNNEKNMRALIRYPARDRDSDWHWYSFPPPPYDAIGTGENDPRPRYAERRDMLGAYTVVGESHIWASTRIRGTYSMDTASATWSKPSDSPLPFWGRAEYAPEHGLWFGFPNHEWQPRYRDTGLLCAWDLNPVRAGGAAEARGVWEGLGTGTAASDVSSHLVHLGDGGRFCVAKLYRIDKPLPASACIWCYNDGMPVEISFAVLPGVEVERCHDGELRMIKHRSWKYSFGEFKFPHALM